MILKVLVKALDCLLRLTDVTFSQCEKMNQTDKNSVIDGHVRKEAARLKDIADFRGGVTGDVMALRNGRVPMVSERKAGSSLLE